MSIIVQTIGVSQQSDEYIGSNYSDIILTCSGQEVFDKEYKKIYVVVKNIHYYIILQIKQVVRNQYNEQIFAKHVKEDFKCGKLENITEEYKSFIDSDTPYYFYKLTYTNCWDMRTAITNFTKTEDINYESGVVTKSMQYFNMKNSIICHADLQLKKRVHRDFGISVAGFNIIELDEDLETEEKDSDILIIRCKHKSIRSIHPDLMDARPNTNIPQYLPSVVFWDIETTTRKNDVKDIKTVSEPYMISVVYQKGTIQD
jgi:hypothetical protein